LSDSGAGLEIEETGGMKRSTDFIAVLGLLILVGSSSAQASALLCRDAFPVNSFEQFEHLRQISGFPDYSNLELTQMTDLANRFRVPAAKLYERTQALKQMADRDLALALNNGELIRLAAVTAKTDISLVKKTFETILVQIRVSTPVGGIERAVKVPHKVLARLTALSILSGESPGSVAFEYNERFPVALKAQPTSPEDMIFAKPPAEVALKMTIEASPLSAADAEFILQ
jgi:hypothetical protein